MNKKDNTKTNDEDRFEYSADMDSNVAWWKHLPIGSEHIIREIAAERILHELLDKVNKRDSVEYNVIRNVVQEFPGTCYKTYEFQWEDGTSRHLMPLAMICCLCPPLETVQAVYKANPGAILVQEPYKQALPFHLVSAFEASVNVVEFIYSKHKSAIATERNDGVYPIHLACGFYLGDPSVLNFLLRQYPQGASKVCTVIEWSPLHSACHGGVSHVPILERLHQLEPTMINRRDKHGRTPLHLACRSNKGNGAVVKFLVRTAPANINVRDTLEWWTPLFLACVYQPPSVIQALLEVVDISTIRTTDARTGDTLLHWASMGNHQHPESIEFLAQRFPHMLLQQTTDNAQATPLCRAVEHGAPLETIRILIQYGPRALFVDNGAGLRPLLAAKANGNYNDHHRSLSAGVLSFRGGRRRTAAAATTANLVESVNRNSSNYTKELVELLKQSEKTHRACAHPNPLWGFTSRGS